MKNLLIYGLQRSGTNYLEASLKNHYKKLQIVNTESTDHPGHKHFRIYDNKSIYPEPAYHNSQYFTSFKEFEKALSPNHVADYYLVLSKSPYSWYISYIKWAHKCNWSAPNYHYIDEYNLFYGKWLEFARETDRIVFIRYIDLLLKHKETLKQINAKLQLSPRLIKKPGLLKVSKSGWFTPGKQHYYKNQEYLNEYSKSALQALNNKLDHEVTRSLGYQIHTG